MKKIIIILIFILPTNLFAFEKVTNFTFEKFNKLNSEGKTIIINSWNEWCTVCAAQTSIFAEASAKIEVWAAHTVHHSFHEFIIIVLPSEFNLLNFSKVKLVTFSNANKFVGKIKIKIIMIFFIK